MKQEKLANDGLFVLATDLCWILATKRKHHLKNIGKALNFPLNFINKMS